MEDLSLHILDIAENAVSAGATTLNILVVENPSDDLLTIEIRDDGRGMDDETVARVADPFYTTRKTRRIGLGLPLLEEAAVAANGHLLVRSAPTQGTTVTATFQLSHIDRKPLGDMAGTITTLVAGQPEMHITYTHQRDQVTLSFSTEEIRLQLDGVQVNSPEVLKFIREYLCQQEESLFGQS